MKILLLLSLFTSLVFSDETIDEKLQAIQDATPQERVQLVNEFKTLLATLSSDGRASAISELRNSMSVTATESSQTKDQAHTHQPDINQEIQQIHQTNQHLSKTNLGSGIKNQHMGSQ